MNIFLDCGFYVGNVTKSYLDKKIINDDWLMYAFEPNPITDAKEVHKNINLIEKAVWINNGQKMFKVGGRFDAGHLKGTTSCGLKDFGLVETIDFSEFVENLPVSKKIICSMDIEGAEYRVLEKMIRKDTINRINLLDIEFHHRFMADYTSIESQKLIDELEKIGVKVKLKVELS